MEISQNQAPIHQGKMLQNEFLKPYHITSTKLAKKSGFRLNRSMLSSMHNKVLAWIWLYVSLNFLEPHQNYGSRVK
jgi:hypothetical protein